MSRSKKNNNKKQKNNIKKLIITLFIFIVIILLVIFMCCKFSNKENIENTKKITETKEKQYVETLENGTKVNISDELKKEKAYENLKFSNMNFTEKNGISNLLADVTNTSDKKHEIEKIKIILLNEKDEVVTEVSAIIGEIKPKETIQLNANVTADVVNVKNFKIEKIE